MTAELDKALTEKALTADLADEDLYADGVPHDIFAQLREHDPVHWQDEKDGPGFWSVTRYRDIEEVSRNPGLFSSDRKWGGHRIFDEKDRIEVNSGVSIISQDPPRHMAVRRTVVPTMGAKHLRDMETRIRDRTRRLLAGIADKGEAEWVSAFAAPLPIETLAELMDVPPEDRDRLFEWSNAIIAEADPEMRPSVEYMQETLGEMATYAVRIWEERQGKPGTDILSLLMNTPIDGKPISVEDYLANFALIIVGGNETTRNSITGSVMALTEFPGQRALLLRDRSLIPSAVSEIIRWVTPVLHMRRTATEDTELGGKTIKRGGKVVLWYCSGNRDAEIFDDPFTFDITRMARFGNRVMHLGFGKGEHMCLGRKLAELQLQIFLEELLDTLPDIRATSEPRRVKSNFVLGYKDLDTAFTPIAASAA